MTEAWQRQVYSPCQQVIDGQYPIADGPDAGPGDVAGLLAPDGTIMRFFSANLEPYIDQSASPWRWKPEARFQGLTPESAAFFERAVTLSQALFDEAGRMQMELSLAALAERGTTTFALGGTGVPVRANGAPAVLAWPGPEPNKGVQVSFREAVSGAHIDVPGHWGLHRMLDGLRLRFRDDGARVLVDLRTEEGRVFVEMGLGAPLNPLSARSAIRGFSCPPSL
jgi:type VI protein secretion system component VasK